MELLKERIREEGIVLNNRVLKVDGFLNQIGRASCRERV